MGTHIKVDLKGLQKFQQNMSKLNAPRRQQFTEAAIKELAARLLRKVIKRTPVGDYRVAYQHTLKGGKNKGQTVTRYKNPSGKVGGTLRRGWTGGEESNAAAFINTMAVKKSGDMYTIEIINPVEYAPYVEFGHRTADHSGWVDGKFMLTISEAELQADAPGILQRKLDKFVKDTLGK